MVTTNYLGRRVLSTYGPIEFLGTRWAAVADIDMETVERPLGSLYTTLSLITAGALLAICIFGYWLANRVSAPLVELTSAAHRIAQGNVQQRIAYQARDEVGQLAEAFRKLIGYVGGMARTADELAQGDLTVEVEAKSDVDVLAHSFTQMARRLREVFARLNEQSGALDQAAQELSAAFAQMAGNAAHVSANAGTVAAASEEMSMNMKSISASAEQSSTSIGSVATATEEMTATISEIARNAEQGVRSRGRRCRRSRARCGGWTSWGRRRSRSAR
jgi:methyl-accepting chemotaxis protein